MKRNFVISYILSVYYDGINFLPVSISAQSENELLQNALNIKLYQPSAILLQWHKQVVQPPALQCLILKLFPLYH